MKRTTNRALSFVIVLAIVVSLFAGMLTTSAASYTANWGTRVHQGKQLLHRQLQLRHAVFPLRQQLQQRSRHLRQPPRHRAA